MKITISGLPGSGTTTIARILSRRLNLKLISAGEVFRRLASEKGMSIEEFGKYAMENPEIDRLIDKTQKEIGEKEDDVLVEGRLAGWMVKKADLKVWIFADPEVRYLRIAKREKRELDTIRRETILREKVERERYKKFYGIDINNILIYDLLVNSTNFKPDQVCDIIIHTLKIKLKK